MNTFSPKKDCSNNVYIFNPQLEKYVKKYLFEYHTINVLSEHVEEKPVAHFAFLHQRVHNFPLDQTKPGRGNVFQEQFFFEWFKVQES